MKYPALALTLVIAALLPNASLRAAQPNIGVVTQRDYNGATVEPSGSSATHAILFKDGVFALDTVRTGTTATTELQFLDQTKIQVGSGAELRLDDFVYNAATTQGGGKISFAVGAFRYVGGKMTTEENIRLRTPTATMIIRGTELVIYVWPDGTTQVNVVSGAVEVSGCATSANRLAMTGMQVNVTPDCATSVAAAPALPADFAALSLPDREPESDGNRRGKGGGDNDRGHDSDPGRSKGGGSQGGGSSSGGSSGGGNASGGLH
ncbi:FecR domain-containing protein [Dongia sp.]|uniref:FecR family protein n=1 Tax=Dongia sp. TaxID=1977262 RepID=UPI0035B2F14A